MAVPPAPPSTTPRAQSVQALVLNASYEPLCVVSGRRAVVLLLTDKAVPVENSVQFHDALTKHQVPGEIHIYEKGRHGLGLALKEGDRDLPYAAWPGRCVAWMKGRGILTEKK